MSNQVFLPISSLDELITQKPEVAAVISEFDLKQEEELKQTQQSKSRMEGLRKQDKIAATYLSMFSDLRRACNIKAALIQSPRDLMTTEFTYSIDSSTAIPPATKQALITKIKSKMETAYKLKKISRDALKEVISGNGVYATAILPEATIPALGTAEYTAENLRAEVIDTAGTIKPRGGMIESVTMLDEIEICDNIDLMRLPSQIVELNKDATKRRNRPHRYSSESKATDPHSYLLTKNSRTETSDTSPAMTMPDRKQLPRKSIGGAITVRLSKYNTIPVYAPGDPNNHTHYIIPLDASGYPIESNIVSIDKLNKIDAKLDAFEKGAMGTGILEKASRALKERDALNAETRGDSVNTEMFESYLRGKLKEVIANGGDLPVEISENRSLYKMILAYVLSSQKVRLMVLPASSVSYITFSHDSNGVGESRLAEINTLNSLRALMMYSSINKEVRSNIETTNVEIAVDPKSSDPDKVTAVARRSVMKMFESMLPGGLYQHTDFLTWIHKAGVRFSYTEHPGIPNTKLNFNHDQRSHNMDKDSGIMKELRDLTIQHVGISPEMVDSGFDTEFATLAENNKELTAKEAVDDQEVFASHLSKLCSMICGSDGDIVDYATELLTESKELKDYLSPEQRKLLAANKEAFIEDLVYEQLENVGIAFPAIDNSDETAKSRAFMAYMEDIDKAIPFFIDQEFLDIDVVGDLSDFVETTKEAWKAHMMRDWCAKNDFMPELTQLTQVDDTGRPVHDISALTSSYTEGLMGALANYLESLKKTRKDSATVIDKIETELDDEPEEEAPVEDEPEEEAPVEDEPEEDEPEAAPEEDAPEEDAPDDFDNLG